MDRIWFLTWHTYGTWLPGDPRGFVSPIRDEEGNRTILNVPETPVADDNPKLRGYAQTIMRGTPIQLDVEKARVLLAQLLETAQYRKWQLLAVAIMPTHVHLIVAVPGDPHPDTLLRDFKSYASRALNRHWGKPANGTWWTESGSKRIIKTESYRNAAIQYVLHKQENPLLTWSPTTNREQAASQGERPALAGRGDAVTNAPPAAGEPPPAG